MIAAEPIMDIIPLHEVKVSDQTREMFAQASELARMVNDFRPMSQDVLKAAEERLFSERIFNTNAIEGSRVTLRETQMILQGQMLPGPSEREGKEVLNMQAAIRLMEREMVPAANPWTEKAFLGLHRVLMYEVEKTAGEYRTERIKISGAKYQPGRAELVESSVQMILKTVAEAGNSIHPILLATWIHWGIARVHPFMDGNGRTSRLCQDLVLLRARLAPAIIRQEDRTRYYDSLQSADEGDFDSLSQLIARRTSDTLEEYIRAQQEIELLKDWAAKITPSDAGLRKATMPYLQWRHKMESIQDDFKRCVAKAVEAGIQIKSQWFPILDEATWKNVVTGLHSDPLLFFEIEFAKDRGRIKYLFQFYSRNFLTDSLDDLHVFQRLNDEPATPTLLLADVEARGNASLAALSLKGNEVIAVHLCGPSPGSVMETHSVTAMKFAMRFIEEALKNK